MKKNIAHLEQLLVNDMPVRGGVLNVYKYTLESDPKGEGPPKAELDLVIKAPRADIKEHVTPQMVQRCRNAMDLLGTVRGVQLPLYITDELEMISYKADGSLEQLIDNSRFGAPSSLTLDHVKQMVTTMLAMHDQGIVHCDIKPGNITYFKKEGKVDEVKIMDWDQAYKKGDKDWEEGRRVTFHGTPDCKTQEYLNAEVTYGLQGLLTDIQILNEAPFSFESLQCADFYALGKTLADCETSGLFGEDKAVSDVLTVYIGILQTITLDKFTSPTNAQDALFKIREGLQQLLAGQDELVVGNKERKPSKTTTSKKGIWLGYGGLALAAIGCVVSIGVGIVAQAAVTSAIILIPSIALVVMALMVVGYGLNKKTSSSKPDDGVGPVHQESKSTKSNLPSNIARGVLLKNADVAQKNASAPVAAHGELLTGAKVVGPVHQESKSPKSSLPSSASVAAHSEPLTSDECKTILTDFRSMKGQITIYDRFGKSQNSNDSFDAGNPSTAQIKTQLAMNPKWPEQYRPQQEAQKPVVKDHFNIMDSGVGWAGLEVPSTTCEPAKTDEFKPLDQTTTVSNEDLEKIFKRLISDTGEGPSSSSLPGGKRPGS